MFPLWEYFYVIAYFFKRDYEQAVASGVVPERPTRTSLTATSR